MARLRLFLIVLVAGELLIFWALGELQKIPGMSQAMIAFTACSAGGVAIALAVFILLSIREYRRRKGVTR